MRAVGLDIKDLDREAERAGLRDGASGDDACVDLHLAALELQMQAALPVSAASAELAGGRVGRARDVERAVVERIRWSTILLSTAGAASLIVLGAEWLAAVPAAHAAGTLAMRLWAHARLIAAENAAEADQVSRALRTELAAMHAARVRALYARGYRRGRLAAEVRGGIA
jgi:hypothetical protein